MENDEPPTSIETRGSDPLHDDRGAGASKLAFSRDAVRVSLAVGLGRVLVEQYLSAVHADAYRFASEDA
jgi:hypothetical protein